MNHERSRAGVSAGLVVTLVLIVAGCRLPGPGSPGSSTSAAEQGDATPTAVTTVRERVPVAALSSAKSAPACEYPSAVMVDGSRRMGPDEPGDVALVIGADGDTWSLATTLTGEPDRLVRFECGQGGVGWPEVLAVNGATYEHASVYAATRSGDAVIIRWSTDGGAGFDMAFWTGVLQLNGDRLELTGVHER
jgi:hypothetical protein